MFLGARGLLRTWQVGDGREKAAARAVLARARPGDLNAAITTLDDFASLDRDVARAAHIGTSALSSPQRGATRLEGRD